MNDARIRNLRTKPARYALRVAPRLSLVVHPTGAKTWIWRGTTGGERKALKLGTWPRMTMPRAMRTRGMLELAMAMAKDPAAEMERIRRDRRKPLTLEKFSQRWMTDVVMKVRKDPAPVERMLRRDILPALGARPLAQIGVPEVTRLVFARRDSGHPEAAAAMRHLLKRLFDYAIACSEMTVNVAAAVPMKFVAKHKARTRSLSEAELRLFYQRLPAMGRIGWALELLLLTLARKSELRLARWEHVNLRDRTWEVPAENSKTGVPHVVYLSRRAVAVLEHLREAAGRAAHVLPLRDSVTEPIGRATLNKAIARVKWGFPAFTPHDLRRTASTILNEKGYNPDWIEACLNHAPKGVRGIYNRARYGDGRRRMLEEWATYLEGLKD